MKIKHISTALALLALEASAKSCKKGVIDIELAGRDSSFIISVPEDGSTVAISQSISVPPHSPHPSPYTKPSRSKHSPLANHRTPLANPMAVYSITPPYEPLECPTKCTFLALDGAVNYYAGHTIDPDSLGLDPPQAQIAVACTTADKFEALCETATSYNAGELHSCTSASALGPFPTLTGSATVPPTTTASSVVPPYPTGTGPGDVKVGGSTGSVASTGFLPTGTGIARRGSFRDLGLM